MKKIYLTITAITLFLIGIIFTLAPNQYLGTWGAKISDANLLHVFRSFGGFYMGFVAYLVIALLKKNLIDGALVATVLAMSGLLIGRIVSLIVEGMPDTKLWIAMGIELIFAVWGLIILWHANRKANIDTGSIQKRKQSDTKYF